MFLFIIKTYLLFNYSDYYIYACVQPWFHLAGDTWASRNGSAEISVKAVS